MRFMIRFLGFLFTAGTVVFLVGVAAAAGMLWHYSKDLPDYSQLQDYEPPVMTRVHATDGALLAEYSKERRLYLPIQAVPTLVINAFLAAEDKNFYAHGGIDYSGMARAALLFAQNFGSGRRPQGASTITQQVAKNFLLTNEVSFNRKIKEALLAMRLERAYSKDKILELYLNEIYLGLGAYGIAAASLVYFDKSVNELTVAEASYLASLPKAPAALHPIRNRDRAIERRNYVVDRLLENGWIKQADADLARKDPLAVTNRSNAAHIFAGEYFAEEVRRDVLERYGEKKLYEGGLSVRATLDPKLQVMARKTMAAGLVNFDEAQGWRGAASKLDISGDWGVKLADVKSLSDIAPWRLAVVLESGDQSARIGFQPGRELGGALLKDRQTGNITLEGVRWAKAASAGPMRGKTPTSVSQVLAPGDVIYADPLIGKDGIPVQGQYRLRQLPEVSGAMVAMDPWTGRVLAMVGGFSFDQSQFNRATQAYRQPGSSFKPIVYSSALDNGYTPSTVMIDAPIEIDQGQGGAVWRPDNFSVGHYKGPTTLREALKWSLNTVTVRLAQDVGMPLIGEYAKRFGVYDELPNYLSYSLGAGETTVMRMVTAYSMFANGGRRVKASLIDRIQDRYGHTIFKHDARECRGCDAPNGWKNQPEPQLVDHREQVLDAMTAYQITEMMEGVVQGGTAAVLREVGKPIAGKTGTTSDAKDVWFVGFSSDLVVGLYLGYDKPRSLGRAAQGGHTAAPIAKDFMKLALADKPAIPFKMPLGLKLVWVDAKTGLRATPGDGSRAIREAFKPGTAPSDNYSAIGVADADGRSLPMVPDSDRTLMRSGTGGLY
jgi:penicillin-binding protein 1A